ncbi:MAG: M14 family zinc carboxypeptidase [Deltaproteobacteria bacterium]|nr:M14 family zinc carboxypeptidase [Deltaproteobacteria bacterium]
MNKKIFFLVFLPALFYGHLLMARDYRPQELPVFLDTLQRHFRTLGWDDLDPGKIPWESHRVSHLGKPLFFTTFGEAQKNTTVFLAGVHGNESPSVYMTLRLAQHLTQNPQVYKNSFIVIAPLVNPDGFFAKPQKRTNARGVDINRNFPTQDWRKGKKDQYFPGPWASSENETKFQIALFQRFKPEKIVSIHAPFGCYDYDGPSSDLDDFVQWLKKSSRENNFPLRRYRVFPGSLGNYAGVERKISTLTLELPSSIPQNGPAYFDQFRNTLIEILHQYPNGKH